MNCLQMTKKIKLAISFFALCQTMVLILDELQGTSLYRQMLKNLSNRLMKQVEKEIDLFYTVLNEESEQYFHKTTEMVETMVNVIKHKDLDLFIEMLKEYEKGNIKILDGNKHKKMISQLESV